MCLLMGNKLPRPESIRGAEQHGLCVQNAIGQTTRLSNAIRVVEHVGDDAKSTQSECGNGTIGRVSESARKYAKALPHVGILIVCLSCPNCLPCYGVDAMQCEGIAKGFSYHHSSCRSVMIFTCGDSCEPCTNMV